MKNQVLNAIAFAKESYASTIQKTEQSILALDLMEACISGDEQAGSALTSLLLEAPDTVDGLVMEIRESMLCEYGSEIDDILFSFIDIEELNRHRQRDGSKSGE